MAQDLLTRLECNTSHDQDTIQFFYFLSTFNQPKEDKKTTTELDDEFLENLKQFADKGVAHAKRLIAETVFSIRCEKNLGTLSTLLVTPNTPQISLERYRNIVRYFLSLESQILTYLTETEFMDIGETAYIIARLLELQADRVESRIILDLYHLSAALEHPFGCFSIALQSFKQLHELSRK